VKNPYRVLLKGIQQLPEKRLCSREFIDIGGQCCTIGARAYGHLPPDARLNALSRTHDHWGTTEEAVRMAYDVPQHIIHLAEVRNDGFSGPDDERYAYMLGWTAGRAFRFAETEGGNAA
jgi:hypothetical protein